MIQATNLRKTFGKITAVDDVSFEAPDGKITGLLGPNGAGKTTTLRMIYTLYQPDCGTAVVDGMNCAERPVEVRQAIGALPDSHGLYARLTSRENVRYYGQLHGMRGKALEDSIDELLDLLDMRDIEHRRTQGFSSGQRVKVAIARALVHRPPNVLLDEPTVGLDVMSTRAMRDFIRQLRDQGRCVVFSSHIMQEVSALCDNIIIIDRGRVVASGSPDDLLRQTGQADLEDAFVAAIGSEEGLVRA
ncbi:MAG: ABC transporter [Anaerolineae bacterium UTCFX2]|mgnify:CR=1 FL=1|jgi:sodium transport system ATP-binding protein|nr:ATP-binding cassette domain-containing protein [Anaerolineae bacterium]MCZ7553780.1 ATP-binding cassette domain-containing protein [Anaerolineales bacterium]OQY89828.1 MAG: ABC transporter [Anaerolineae bacterium UTCFX2]